MILNRFLPYYCLFFTQDEIDTNFNNTGDFSFEEKQIPLIKEQVTLDIFV